MNKGKWDKEKQAFVAGKRIQWRSRRMSGWLEWEDCECPVWDTSGSIEYRVKPDQPRKHRDLIIKWANGARIQYKDKSDDTWQYVKYPAWDEETEYRVEPERKPDIVIERYIYSVIGTRLDWTDQYEMYGDKNMKPNARLIFDGETRELKSVEVIQ